MTYLLFCTPKAHAKITDALLADTAKKLGCHKIEVHATTLIYMNMQNGWTEDKCDNTAYLVEKESFERSPLSLGAKLKNLYDHGHGD